MLHKYLGRLYRKSKTSKALAASFCSLAMLLGLSLAPSAQAETSAEPTNSPEPKAVQTVGEADAEFDASAAPVEANSRSEDPENDSESLEIAPQATPQALSQERALSVFSCGYNDYYSLSTETGEVWKINGVGDETKVEKTSIDFSKAKDKNGKDAKGLPSYYYFNGLAIGAKGKEAYAYQRYTREYQDGSADYQYLRILKWTEKDGVRVVYDQANPDLRYEGQKFIYSNRLIAGGMIPSQENGIYYFGGYTVSQNAVTGKDPSMYWDEDSGTWKKGTFRDGRWQHKVREYIWFRWVDNWYDCEGQPYTYNPVYFHLFAFENGNVKHVGNILVDKENAKGVNLTANGDLSFDDKGNMFLLYHSSTGEGKLLTVKAEDLKKAAGGEIPAEPIRDSNYGTDVSYNGLAVNSDGKLLVQYSGLRSGAKTSINVLNPMNGDREIQKKDISSEMTYGEKDRSGSDLASCTIPPTVKIQKDLTRKKKTDDFRISIDDAPLNKDGSAPEPFVLKKTNHLDHPEDGIQTNAIVGPVIVRPGAKYYFREAPANKTTKLSDYEMNLECKMDDGKNEVFLFDAEGGKQTENIFQQYVEIPNPDPFGPGRAMTCTFVNKPKTTLTLKKQVAPVVNGVEGLYTLAKPENFKLIALDKDSKEVKGLNGNPEAGKDFISATVKPGTYSLSEASDENFVSYAQKGDWSCADNEGKKVDTVKGEKTESVTVEAGKDVTCTVTNTTAELTVLKYVKDKSTGLKPSDVTVSAKAKTDTQKSLSAEGSEEVTKNNSIPVLPGGELTLSEKSNFAYLANKLEKYVGTNPNTPDMNAANDWQEVDRTKPVSVQPGEHAVYRFVNSAPPQVVLPLSGGISRTVFVVLALGLLGLGTTTIVLARRRQRLATK
ncbi:hypothetical protein HMPREF9306_00979 [Propionimicrobium lymphophilum ACS-093-V-SCH5]|uniref:Uncharacterized protein n=2 Tax=Propionimicrobium TaxID=203133 RepID=S2X0C5_9ACTN|nr:hypothetical protein [Propionimicrobium lymphophilum]EPD33439.1 hypothetical protein HMPREF9306_00979 [Propionimicrobium lymphophilum ACS-093-V-SCH5]MDK7709818.1 hypothetical protein [Propionimicrobium lymphophilum]